MISSILYSPDYHRIQDLTFKNTEKLGNTPIDRKAIFDIYLTEQDSYQSSLKYYRDMNNVVDTARQEGREEGQLTGQSNVLLRLLPQAVGELPNEVETQINLLSLKQLGTLAEMFLDFNNLNDLVNWLDRGG